MPKHFQSRYHSTLFVMNGYFEIMNGLKKVWVKMSFQTLFGSEQSLNGNTIILAQLRIRMIMNATV
jgi:hypothetical protein